MRQSLGADREKLLQPNRRATGWAGGWIAWVGKTRRERHAGRSMVGSSAQPQPIPDVNYESPSQLQDIACVQCDVVLGIKCLTSPINHVLDE